MARNLELCAAKRPTGLHTKMMLALKQHRLLELHAHRQVHGPRMLWIQICYAKGKESAHQVALAREWESEQGHRDAW